MKYIPKEIEEEVNVTPVHPLVNFAYLLGTVVGVSIFGYLALGLVSDQITTRISLELEVKIGKHLLPSDFVQKTIKNDPRLPYLTQLVTSLSQANSPESQIPLTVHLLEIEQINAFVTPGGHIFVTTGLLDAVESENELAFVLAHELAHISARDAFKVYGRSTIFLVFISTILGVGGNSQGADIVSTTGSLTHLNYSRKQEQNADYQAMSTIIAYYGHGADSLGFFTKINAEGYGKHTPEYFSTHPLTEKRIDNLKQMAIDNNWQLTGKLTPLPKEFKD